MHMCHVVANVPFLRNVTTGLGSSVQEDTTWTAGTDFNEEVYSKS